MKANLFRRPRRLMGRMTILAALVLIMMPTFQWLYAQTADSTKTPTTKDSWHMKMNEISAMLRELAPFLYSETAFQDPANRQKIEQITEKLSGLAHQIEQGPKKNRADKAGDKATVMAPDHDPALIFLSRQFNDSLDRAHESFKQGHTEYARALLRTTVSYCISCHTRTETQAAVPQAGYNDAFKGLSGSERIRFFAATRQFDRVSEEFETAFNEKTKASVVDLETAARIALSVLVRVKGDLAAAENVAKRVAQHPSAPDSLKADAQVWLKELQLWKQEAAVTPTTPEALLAAARELVIKAQVLQASPGDSRGDISYLKASALLHDLLKKTPKPEVAADALYYIGVCYEALHELGFWTLHENYYEACIQRRPHTTRAQVCYERLNDSITAGYTGSRGTDIPIDIQRHLGALKRLAKPADAASQKASPVKNQKK